ncbi:MAG: histidine phosphatase family protein [Oenococcus sp.]|uniref:histidine phosphatase family protein n=1 Tax=Oenococcus TaxID=46254 RepID=UPI0021E8F898|nr:histidine phosphatase family protein [Oenococcus kitaharae]MCV3296643.1 histidine phosphatase family protein [Oenococcus kitaharae]
MTEQGINVFFVRHGQTYFNLMGRFQGWSDIDLTEKGIADGKAAGIRLAGVHFKAAFSSDLPRAYNTARFVLNANQANSPALPTAEKDFREIFFGSAEGLTIQQIVAEYDHGFDKTMQAEAVGYGDTIEKFGFDGLMDLFKKNDPLHLAEDSAEFNQRLTHGLNMIRETFKAGDNVLVVTHGSLMRALANKFQSAELASHKLDNGAISKLIFEPKKDGRVTIAAWNDTEKIW